MTLDDMLSAWAEWSLRQNEMGLGYTRESLTYKIMSLGADGAAIRGNGYVCEIRSNDTVEAVERAIISLVANERKVILLHYLRGGVGSDYRADAVARKNGLSRSTYYRYLADARRRLAEILGVAKNEHSTIK